MKNVIIYAICIFVFLSCNTAVKNEKVETGIYCEKSDIERIDSTILGINQVLLDKLDAFIKDINSVKFGDYKIIEVYFYMKKDDCYVTLSSSDFYSSDLDGYYIKDGKMIAFYITDSECNSLVDLSKMKKDKTEKFLDESSSAIWDIYEPVGMVFKIHNKDSLELIFQGYL